MTVEEAKKILDDVIEKSDTIDPIYLDPTSKLSLIEKLKEIKNELETQKKIVNINELTDILEAHYKKDDENVTSVSIETAEGGIPWELKKIFLGPGRILDLQIVIYKKNNK